MTLNDYRLKEKSKIFLRRNEQQQIEIYIESSTENRIIEKITNIPSRFLDFIEEIPIKDSKFTRIIYSYFDRDTKEHILELVECSFNEQLTYHKERLVSVMRAYRICPGTYCYKRTNGELTLIRHTKKTFCPEKLYAYYKYEDKQPVTKVTFPQNAVSIDNYHYLEMCIHFEPEEILHTILKISPDSWKEFQISNHVWSEMTNQEYLLWDKTQNGEYTDYDYFSTKFENSQLAKEIVYMNHWRQEQNQKKGQDISNKVLKRIRCREI